MPLNQWRLHFIQPNHNSYVEHWMRFKHIYNMYRFIVSIRLIFQKIRFLPFYTGAGFWHSYRVAQKKIYFIITWDPVNRFQCSIPCFGGHSMPIKMRYKAMYNYNPIKFYELNHLCCHIDMGGTKIIFLFFKKFIHFFSFSGLPCFNYVSQTAIFSHSCEIFWKIKK